MKPSHRSSRPWRFCCAAAIALSAIVAFPRAFAEAPAQKADRTEAKTKFLRYVNDGHGGAKLESAIVTYRNTDGATVHLVAALHVGEPSYYQGLSESFKGYDALLYEMIKPKDSDVPRPGVRSDSTLSMFQRFLTERLKLQFQLDGIDYSAPNFVHADLDVETFFKLQEERGETILTLMLRSMMSEMGRQSRGEGAPPITIFDLIGAMMSPDSSRQYKLLLGRQFEDIESQLAGWDGENGTVILTERNKAAISVLKDTLAQGKRDVGVFYGAGHMVGLEKLLTQDLGFHRTGVEWRLAWDMSAPPATQPSGAKGVAGDVAQGQGERADQPKQNGDDAKKQGE